MEKQTVTTQLPLCINTKGVLKFGLQMRAAQGNLYELEHNLANLWRWERLKRGDSQGRLEIANQWHETAKHYGAADCRCFAIRDLHA